LKYLDIVDWIKSELAEGKLKAGDRLPSENELAEKFRVSRQTARHAIDVLAADRLVSRVRGSGTYIGTVGGRIAGTGLHPGRNRHHGTIAVMSTYVDGYIFPNTVRGIEQVLVRSGYVMQLCFTGNKIHRERELLEKMVSTDRIDGLIVEAVKSALPNPNFKYFSRLSGLGVPILFINAAYPGLPYPLVALDDPRMAFKATQYLVDRGHRKIAGIFKADDGQGRLRYQGYAECMRTIGRGVDERSVFWIDTVAMQEMEKFAPYLLERIHGRTAVGWDEILETGIPGDAVVMSWRGSAGGKKAASLGHKVIMSPNTHCYFDYYQDLIRKEPKAVGELVSLRFAYGYEPLAPGMDPDRLLGVQANLWTELIPTAEHAEYMLYPRLFALAETAGTPAARPHSRSETLSPTMRQAAGSSPSAAGTVNVVAPDIPVPRSRKCTEAPVGGASPSRSARFSLQ